MLKMIHKLGLFSISVLMFFSACQPKVPLRPDWAQDLIIYEVATKGFTSPNGPESGTFRSLMEKMEYLEDLGVNAIWLTGHSLSDSNHFYGIWTQYACIEPDKLDPSLGTEAEFKAMIAEAHRRGIRIFLDTIEHGVMNDSPLIEQHPDWFKGGSWGMTDYDWDGNHPDLEEWWIEMWTKAVLDWGVDGFRCDCGLHRPDLWLEIKRRCAAAGKPIFILGESGVENVSDACQRDIMLFNQRRGRLDNHAVLTNLSSVKDLFHQPFGSDDIAFNCTIFYEDGSIATNAEEDGTLKLRFLGLGEDVIGFWERDPDGSPDWDWLIRGSDRSKEIRNIQLTCPERSWRWQLQRGGWQLAMSEQNNGLKISGGNPLPGPKLRIISPSCHDCGWEGFPIDKNPYTVQGSRFVFGYGSLFAPAIPIFMSGEEFDADYRPLPRLTPDLYGKEEAGTGRWLYGSWLQWDQIKEERHRDMLEDVKRMLAIRKGHRDLIHAVDPEKPDITIQSISVISSVDLPVPYLLSNGKKALLVVGNPTENTVEVELQITGEILDNAIGSREPVVTNLWPQEKPIGRVDAKDLAKYKIKIPRDGIPGGGLAVLCFERD